MENLENEPPSSNLRRLDCDRTSPIGKEFLFLVFGPVEEFPLCSN